MTDCIFCKIVAGEIPATIVAESEHAIAFQDIAPEQPVHLLVVPKQHFTDIAALSLADHGLAGQVMSFASEVALAQTNGHFKLQFNTGTDADQTVFHAHAHILAKHLKGEIA